MKLDETLRKVGRVAFRVEGDNWNAYYAMPDSMEGALYLGSMRMTLVERKERKDSFIELMRQCVGDLMEDSMGKRPEWPNPPQPAPEHERSTE